MEEKTVFRFSCKGRKVDEYTVTNFKEEHSLGKSVRCYTIESGGISKRFLIENKGSRTTSKEAKRSDATNVLPGEVANQNAFNYFFRAFAEANNDEVATYTPVEDFIRYFLVELRGCRPLESEEFDMEPLESKAQVLKNIFEMVSDISSFRIAVSGENRKRCSLDFDSAAFYYSPLTKKAYLKDFDGIRFYKHETVVKPDISNLVRFTRNSLNASKCTHNQGTLIAMISEKNDNGRNIDILSELGRKNDRILSFKDELTARFCHHPDEKGFNPVINHLFYEHREDVVDADVRLITDIEECVKSIYACTNINRLHGLVRETEEKLVCLSSDFNDYKQYRYHSVNVEYAKRLVESDDPHDYLDRARRSYSCINTIYERYVKKNGSLNNKDEDALRLKAYVSACLAESAWVTCLVLRKVGASSDLDNLNDGFKKRHNTEYNVRKCSEEAVKYYEQLYAKEKNITNAKLLATACRNRGVYLENYRIDGIPDSPDTVREMYLRAYELMLEYGPALENHKIFHCLISLNLKLASLKRQNAPEEAIEILKKNNEYLKGMVDRGFGKTESYCLLKMMNDYDLFWIQPDENLKEELDDDITRYCAIVGKEKFDKLKDAEKIAELKN